MFFSTSLLLFKKLSQCLLVIFLYSHHLRELWDLVFILWIGIEVLFKRNFKSLLQLFGILFPLHLKGSSKHLDIFPWFVYLISFVWILSEVFVNLLSIIPLIDECESMITVFIIVFNLLILSWFIWAILFVLIGFNLIFLLTLGAWVVVWFNLIIII